MQSGHYSLNCDMTAWVWSHGGSVFTADGQCSLNDAEAVTGVDYMRELQTYMPAAVTTYDWGGQATAIQQGQGGQVITWGEDFPGWDDPANSQVSGLMEAAPLPANAAQRPAAEAGFEEEPDLGHQGGSTYALSRYSQQADPAWIFLQWATSSNTQTLASVIGGGASPMRQSTFDDPRVQANAEVGAGTTRHFPQMYEAITSRMGTEPHLPQWPLIATDIIAVELGRLTTGGYGSTQEGMDTIKRLVDEAAAG
ncbi:MAG: extracellular solute-binding protein [Chloroflexia bacterium]|nr:extracellular solute-binding protein [Chloroflexia bacterium]